MKRPGQVWPVAAAFAILAAAAPARAQKAVMVVRNPNDVVLVVGHSDSVPEVLRLLGHPEAVTIGSAEYDNLFVAIPNKGGPPTVLRLRY